ncbi:MAG: heme ABC transporter ATP-binding protein [Verrucomicrobia bacterium]|nr:MAG: heme ABC transporter ATP-binding protein [Verrucomicrobiota bacterium]
MKASPSGDFSVRSVTFYRRQQRVLHDISLAVALGECVALIGPNGAGKSSLLKIFSGDLSPHSGEVRLDGIPLTAWDRQKIARRRAVLPQQSELLFPLPVRDIVLMGRFPHYVGKATVKDEQIVDEAMCTTDVAELWNRPYDQLSGGQKQRVQLARVLAQVWPQDSAIGGFLLLDEPTTGLDLAHQHAFLRTVRNFTRVGLGVLIVLHDLNLAMQYADRVMILHHGNNAACDSPEKALQPELIRRIFAVKMQILHTPRPVLVPVDE